MVENIATDVRIAKKEHYDDSAEFIEEAFEYILHHGTKSEIEAINDLKKNNWHIQPGQIYEKQYNKMDGITYTFRTLPIIFRICQKYKLYIQ